MQLITSKSNIKNSETYSSPIKSQLSNQISKPKSKPGGPTLL